MVPKSILCHGPTLNIGKMPTLNTLLVVYLPRVLVSLNLVLPANEKLLALTPSDNMDALDHHHVDGDGRAGSHR